MNMFIPKGTSKRVSSSTWCGVGLLVPQISSSLINTSESRDVHFPGPSWKRETQREERGREIKRKKVVKRERRKTKYRR